MKFDARWACLAAAVLGLGLSSVSRGDTVELINGDRYSGRVLSVSLSSVSLRSEIQGLVVLPREKVARIAFSQTTAPTNSIQTKALSDGNLVGKTTTVPTQSPRIAANSTNLVVQVQNQLLAGAGPEATEKYNQMVTDLLNGTLSVPQIRKQARETLKSVEQAKQEFGPELDDLVESYLSVLRDFLQE
jgi:hypothetical protein